MEETSIRTAKFAQIKQGKDKINIVDQLTTNPTKAAKPRKVNERFGKVSGLPKKRLMSATVQNLCKKKLEKAKHVVRKVLPRKTKRPKPYYDEEDRKALSKMKKLRVDWSEMEDALLLNCKVAGLYLFPNPRYLAISFQTVRDVLHQTFKESKNKTSRACQRRILYVMRNAATAHSVSLSLLDLKHDPMINERFGRAVQEAKAIAKSREQLEKLLRPTFIELVNILSKRMDTMPRTTTNPDIIQGDIEDLRSKYTIAFPHSLDTKSRFYDVTCIDDIQKGVLHAVIHSSFCCAADKTSWAYQLFKVYQQYPDSFLKASMNKFRADQMITLKKQYSRYYKTGNFVPISSCPYQLSMNYAYLFQSEYQFEIYQQAHVLLKNMKKFFTQDINGKMEVTAADGGGTATLIELFSRNQATLEAVIPEQIIILDPVIAEKKEAYDGILKRFNQMLDHAYEDRGEGDGASTPGKRKKPSGASKEPAAKRKKLTDDTNDIADDSAMEKADDESLLESRMLSSNATCTASRIALYMMRKELTDSPNIDPHHAHDFFVVNSCEVFCEKMDMETTLEYIQSQTKASEAVLEKIKSSTILPEEYCSLNTLYYVYDKEGADESEWRFACEIMNFVGHGKEVGVTVSELREKFGGHVGKFSLSTHLMIMSRERVLVRVGITTTRYVHYEYTKPWLVHSNKMLRLQRDKLNPTEARGLILHDDGQSSSEPTTDGAIASSQDRAHEEEAEEENHMEDEERCKATDEVIASTPKPKGRTRERRIKTLLSLEKDSESLEWNSTYKIKVMIRPWIRVDGSLNRRVLDRFLGSVLGHILQNPGCCIKDLGNRFAPALQPCHTRELLEILSEIGCVKLVALQMKKPTLFSKASKVVLVEPDGTEDESNVFINPQLDAVSKLGIFLGDKKYTVDFLGKIL
ncbi:hypothetical protein J437_LFUL015503 [Ladona fulva]|uniref:Uncharacterized protein n=1 Tax=Ladona fulva TaxID=123851 RepID=A0A8K0P3W2_LADFU|nr:hypothetical protein J437_LFUL015503 [Ladona fulva]